MKKQIERTISYIKELERRLGEVDSNLKYIKVVQALKKSLDKLYVLLLKDTTLQGKYQLPTLPISTMVVDSHAMTGFATLLLNIRTETDLSNYTFLY